MAKNNEDLIVDVEEVYSKTEQYIEQNQKSLLIIVGVAVLIIGSFFGYKFLYLGPLEEEANQWMWKAEQFFEKDSLEQAIYGQGEYLGFLDIVDNYGPTKAGNLANYYLGVSFLRRGEFEDAIYYLEDFESDDEVLGPIALGATGDAYMELGDMDKALDYYLKAANKRDNDFTAPIYIMKAAAVHESLNEFSKAKELYIRLKKDFPESDQAGQVDKYLARAKNFSGE